MTIEKQVERLIKLRELKLLIEQFEAIYGLYAEKFIQVENPARMILENLCEFTRIHKNAQEKLQEIASFYFNNREYFFSYSDVEEKIMALLNVGVEHGEIFINILDMVQEIKEKE